MADQQCKSEFHQSRCTCSEGHEGQHIEQGTFGAIKWDEADATTLYTAAQLSQAVEAARREDIESVRRNYVEAYECMEQRIEAATVAITQLQVVIESLKIADS